METMGEYIEKGGVGTLGSDSSMDGAYGVTGI